MVVLLSERNPQRLSEVRWPAAWTNCARAAAQAEPHTPAGAGSFNDLETAACGGLGTAADKDRVFCRLDDPLALRIDEREFVETE